MDERRINLRGISPITLESFNCEICGKPRSQGYKRNQHLKCSKIKQQMYFARGGK